MTPPASSHALTRILCLLAAAAGASRAQSAEDWASQTCAAGWAGDCYIELDRPEKCYFWSGGALLKKEGATVAWSGGCDNALAQGTGTLAWEEPKASSQARGVIEKGRLQGLWIMESAERVAEIGAYRDGRKHGRWIVRKADGAIEKHDYSSGNKHLGKLTLQQPDSGAEGLEEDAYRDGDGAQRDRRIARQAGGAAAEYSDRVTLAANLDRLTCPWGEAGGPPGQRQVEREANGNIAAGAYRDGRRHGKWVWRNAKRALLEGGCLREGKRHGLWIAPSPTGHASRGYYRDDKRHGPWVDWHLNGLMFEGLYRNGRKHGQWEGRQQGKIVDEGLYWDGQRHGLWVEQRINGGMAQGAYQYGQRVGRWVVREITSLGVETIGEGHYKDSRQYDRSIKHGWWIERNVRLVEEGLYRNGKRQGPWVVRRSNGTVAEGPYRDGKKHGQWVSRNADGTVHKVGYRNGERHGLYVMRGSNGTVSERLYRNGEQQGPRVVRHPDGTVEEIPSWVGKKHGLYVTREPNGTVRETLYRDGEQQGPTVVRYPDGTVYELHDQDGTLLRIDPRTR